MLRTSGFRRIFPPTCEGREKYKQISLMTKYTNLLNTSREVHDYFALGRYAGVRSSILNQTKKREMTVYDLLLQQMTKESEK